MPEHPDIPAALLGASVERGWEVQVTAVQHLGGDPDASRWLLGDDRGPRWVATVDRVGGADERVALLAAYETASALARRLSFVVPSVPDRSGRVAVGLTPGLLLSVAPFLDGPVVPITALGDDADRCVLASMIGDLHRQPYSRQLALWRPVIGRVGQSRREELERCLDADAWAGGPWSVPTGRLVADARTALRTAVRRFALLGAAVLGNAERWVGSHGAADAGHLVRTLDGPRLVGWGAMARAPRERDLAVALGEADGDEPWFAYLEAGGAPEPLSVDTVELFALQRHLTRVTQDAVRLSLPHQDTDESRRSFERLEDELAAVLTRWA